MGHLLSGLMEGQMVTSSKRTYSVHRGSQVCCSQSPVLMVGHCWLEPLQEILKHSKAGLARFLVGSLGPGAYEVLFEPFKHLWLVWGLILNVILPHLLSYWGFSFVHGCGVSFFGGIQHSPLDSCSVVSCNFGVLAGEYEYMSFYSTILRKIYQELGVPSLLIHIFQHCLSEVWFPCGESSLISLPKNGRTFSLGANASMLYLL